MSWTEGMDRETRNERRVFKGNLMRRGGFEIGE
jgi:hypothetical protein